MMRFLRKVILRRTKFHRRSGHAGDASRAERPPTARTTFAQRYPAACNSNSPELGVPAATALEVEVRLNGRDVAFDTPVDADEDERPSPAAFLIDHNADPYGIVETASEDESSLDTLHRGLVKLDARSRDIIQRRWLKDEPKATLQELADEYGVSAERIRQIEANAMKKMRAMFVA